MANEFSTAGIVVKFCVETTAGTRPTTGYTTLPNIKQTPDANPQPSALQVTDLSDKEWHRFIPGLKSVGDSLGFTANLTRAFMTAWGSLVTASETARESDKATWFEVAIPNFDSFYFAGYPSPLGLKGMDVDQVAEIDAFVTPNQIVGWASASTT